MILLSVILFAAYVPIVSAHHAPFPPGYDPTHFVIDTIGDPETLDPAWAYDSASGEVIFNVYETLLFYDVVYEDGPYNAGKTYQLVPKLATAMPTIDYSSSEINPKTGSPYYSTWYFPIRTGVQFHGGWGTLTPADVEYSFERIMIQDRDGGPQWMFFEPLMGKYYASLESEPAGADGEEINNAVKSNSTHVWFNLVPAYPELARARAEVVFAQILCQSWASVVCKAWAMGRGDFDGNWARPWQDIYAIWHNPEVSPFDSPDPDMVGTGPYMFSYWNSGTDYSLVRNPHYWNGWPGALPPERYYPPYLGGYIEKVTWRELASWNVRSSNFLAGTSDETVVPRNARGTVVGSIVGGEKIRCYYPLPSLSLSAFFFTLDIATTSKFMGTPLPPGTFSKTGIPPDIFSDINVRKGFAYAFDYNTFLSTDMLNEGTQPADPVIEGVAYNNIANKMYSYDVNKAEYYLKLSWGGVDIRSETPGVVVLPEDKTLVAPGALWNGGMRFTVVYDIGNTEGEKAAKKITDINNLNLANFFLTSLGLDPGTQVLPAMVASELPIFLNGRSADFIDPHDFVFPFQHNLGTFAQYQRYSNPVVDALIVAGITMVDDTNPYNGELDVAEPTTVMNNWREETDPQAYIDSPPDTRWPRRSVYYALQEYYFKNAASIPLAQPLGRHYEQSWMRGWYYNPLYPGEYVYHRWKAKTHFGDVSATTYGRQDGAVDYLDAPFISSHWSNPAVLYGYHPTADINGGIGATTGGLTGPVRGMPDGKVDIKDLGLVAAYWDPSGPSHPF